jgi:hypothetical protein
VVSLTDDGQTHRRILPDLNVSDVLFCENSQGFSRRLSTDTNEFRDAIEQLAHKVASVIASPDSPRSTAEWRTCGDTPCSNRFVQDGLACLPIAF